MALDGALIVQSDKTLLLEVDHERSAEARRAIAPFAELERAPEHIHTYRITPLALWNARAAGLDAETVVHTLITYSRFPVPHALLTEIAETVASHAAPDVRIYAGGRDKHSILADTMEAVFGAIYLEHGLEPSRKVVLEQLGERLDSAPRLGAALDWKTSLQELTAEKGWGAPSYTVTSTGPDHDKEFTATVMVNDAAHGVGVGRSKKEAEQRAASEAWNGINGSSA